jgi:peptide chain release factor subunit 1
MKLTNLLKRLAEYQPDGTPFVSIYLDASPNQVGRDGYDVWLRNEIAGTRGQFEEDTPERAAFEAVIERINAFLESDKEESANGIAIFSSMDGEFFETVQLDEPFPNNRFFLFDRPHIFPLARIIGQNPKYAVLWADTNKASIYLFGGENILDVETETTHKVEEIQNEKTNRTQVGGWSQARYQRHVDNFTFHHAKETVEELEKVMNRGNVEYLFLCGDETTIMPVLRPQLSKATEDKVVGVLNMSQYHSEEEIREKTGEAMSVHNAVLDKACVERMKDAAKAAAGLGTLGVENTLAALSNGQVEELVIASNFDAINYDPGKVEEVLEAYAPGDDNSTADGLPEPTEKRQIADELIVRALNSSAKITFVEDDSLMREAGGVGAVLRYNMNATAG